MICSTLCALDPPDPKRSPEFKEQTAACDALFARAMEIRGEALTGIQGASPALHLMTKAGHKGLRSPKRRPGYRSKRLAMRYAKLDDEMDGLDDMTADAWSALRRCPSSASARAPGRQPSLRSPWAVAPTGSNQRLAVTPFASLGCRRTPSPMPSSWISPEGRCV